MPAPQKVSIILRYTYRNHLDELKDYETDFQNIHVFKNYLRWCPDRAMAIGYGPRDEEVLRNSRSSNVRLYLKIDDKETLFNNASAMADFLKANPEVARAVQFI